MRRQINKKRASLLILGLAAVAAVLAGVLYLINQPPPPADQAAYYTQALTAAGLEAPSTLPDLKLAYARAAAERTPMFALAGTDPLGLQSNLVDLTKARDDVAKGI